MSPSSAVLKSDPADTLLTHRSIEVADQVVLEVFQVMFGLEIQPDDDSCSEAAVSGFNERTAIVGFSGVIRGSCQVRSSAPAAKCIASAMLGGVALEEDDASINDALGELCDMLAGGWKNATPGLASQCSISPPTVISGGNYTVHQRRFPVNHARTYRFGIHLLHLTLHLEDAESAAE